MTLKNSTLPSQEIPLHGKLISAIVGGAVVSTLMTPFDVVKVRLQAQLLDNTPKSSFKPIPTRSSYIHFEKCKCAHKSPFYKNSRIYPNLANIIPHLSKIVHSSRANSFRNCTSYVCPSSPLSNSAIFSSSYVPRSSVINGALDGFVSIFKFEGVRGLYRGLNISLIAALPSTVIYYVGYDSLRSQFRTFWPQYDHYSPLLAGTIARSFSSALISPLELVRTIIQSSSSSDFKSVIAGIRSLIATNGYRTLWAGLIPTLWRDVPFSAIYWFGYEQSLSHLSFSTSHFFNTFIAGAVSGSIAAVLTNPFDVAKTARQVALSQDNSGFNGAKSAKILSIIKNIVASDGYSGLYTGLAPRLLKIAPACAIMISSYELGKSFFKSPQL
ncbi:Solute carrier family 25 member 40 [Smittium mucronatum]|uniref:Solute carrier family 25 member 40 n=1 Tax=Smittium mucronatum TaxID=133383 RepID=A0A1R0H8T2_9FUNG|nr:Solute carrier family 25 member 40 [Smittium mucronatum]